MGKNKYIKPPNNLKFSRNYNVRAIETDNIKNINKGSNDNRRNRSKETPNTNLRRPNNHPTTTHPKHIRAQHTTQTIQTHNKTPQ